MDLLHPDPRPVYEPDAREREVHVLHPHPHADGCGRRASARSSTTRSSRAPTGCGSRISSNRTSALTARRSRSSATGRTARVRSSCTRCPRRAASFARPGAPNIGALGDNDPAWSPDGRLIAFTHNRGQSNDGAPSLSIHNRRTGKTKALKTGYAHPSWAPDGSWLAAELTTGTGRDIVLLDAARGDERARLTTDGDSFAPVVSPDGDQVAYLRRDGPDIDLRVATLAVDDQGRISARRRSAGHR